MKRCCTILTLFFPLLFSCPSLFAQGGLPERQQPGKVVTGIQSISLTFANGVQSRQQSELTANLSSNAQAVNGIAYNNGSALTFRVSSRGPYNINISAEDIFSAPSSFGRATSFDLRDFIYYQLVDNNTGGTATGTMDQNGIVLGAQQKCILAGCPPTTGTASFEEDQTRTFSLIFRIRPGYSIPPGTYKTRVMFTATYE